MACRDGAPLRGRWQRAHAGRPGHVLRLDKRHGLCRNERTRTAERRRTPDRGSARCAPRRRRGSLRACVRSRGGRAVEGSLAGTGDHFLGSAAGVLPALDLMVGDHHPPSTPPPYSPTVFACDALRLNNATLSLPTTIDRPATPASEREQLAELCIKGDEALRGSPKKASEVHGQGAKL